MNFFLNRHRPIVVLDNGSIVTYHIGCIFLFSSAGKLIKKVCELPGKPFLKILSRYRIFERLLRLEPRCGVCLSSNQILFSYRGAGYRLDLDHGKVFWEINFREGMSNPLFFSKVSGIDGLPSQVMFGEYWGNLGKESVRIYGRELGIDSPWKIITEFTAGQITHVHNILSDKYGQRLIILTGDSDKESGIWELKPSSEAPKMLVSGKQIFRSCIGYIQDNVLFYATDTPQEENYFVRLCLTTLEINKIIALEGPVIYGSLIKNQFLFSTSVEPDTDLRGLRYLFSRKVGRGLKSNECVVYSYDGINVIEVNRFKKDFLPMGLFQFGSVSFYSSENNNYAYTFNMSLTNTDGKIYKLAY